MPHLDEPDALDAAIALLHTVRDEWLARPGVTALDVGLRRPTGEPAPEDPPTIAIRVHVDPDRVPVSVARGQFPARLGDYPVDIIAARYGLEPAAGSAAADDGDAAN